MAYAKTWLVFHFLCFIVLLIGSEDAEFMEEYPEYEDALEDFMTDFDPDDRENEPVPVRKRLHRRRSHHTRRRTLSRRRRRKAASWKKKIMKKMCRRRSSTHTTKKGKSSKKIAYDSCNRRCEVKNGKLVNCCRVRKEFLSMSEKEQQRYIRTYTTVTQKQPYKRSYSKLMALHLKYFSVGIHNKPEFFPWHRWLNLEVENLLMKVDCRVTLPYWDWSIWYYDPWNTTYLWSNNRFGGNGRKKDDCVATGPFRVGLWKTSLGNCLRRHFDRSAILSSPFKVEYTLKSKTFNKFEYMNRVILHTPLHCLTGGTMCDHVSSEAPSFFMHHGYIDKIWAEYQSYSCKNRIAYFSKSKKKMLGLKYYPKDLIDIENQPGGIRVCYDDTTIFHSKIIWKFLKSLSRKQLKYFMKKTTYSKSLRNAKGLFKLAKSDLEKAKKLDEELNDRGNKRGLSDIESILSPQQRAYFTKYRHLIKAEQ